MQRRLAAVMAADVVGYSRLIRADEAATLATVKSQRQEVIEPIISDRGGRIVKLMGDGLLIEFASAVEAVRCALSIQQTLADQNRGRPEGSAVRYRIGINIGDIVVDGDDIHGDGVNIAARIEGLAEPGGICVAQNVHDQIKDKVDVRFEDLGTPDLKNIDEAVGVFRIVMDDQAAALSLPAAQPPQKQPRRSQLALIAALLVLLGAGVAWFQPWNSAQFVEGDTDAIGALAGKPSIAVMAFDNLNKDPAQDFLSDGLSENILTTLSRFPDFFVVARNSTFSFKGTDTPVQTIGQDLGVRYVVQGSVQFAGDRVRTNAQLVDAVSGTTLWADQYDRELDDIFEIQDEITRTVASTLIQNIDLAEYNRLKHQPTEDLGAYELRKRAQEQGLKFTRESNALAAQYSAEAIARDPNFAGAYVESAWAHINGYRWGWIDTLSREESLARAFELARKAIELEPLNFTGYWVLASATTQSGDLEKAAALHKKAISLNPNSASVLADSIDPLVYSGNAPEAVERMKAAMQLNPLHQDWYYWNIGWAMYFAKDFEGALAEIEKMREVPNRLKRTLAPVLLRLGRKEEAERVMQEFLAEVPDYSIAEARKSPFIDQGYLDFWLDDLRQLGVPETSH